MLREAHLIVEIREKFGKIPSKKIRKEGKIPAILYGGDLPAMPISILEKDFKELLRKKIHENTIFYLKVKEGENPKPALIKDYQIDPVTGKIIHIDFIRISMEKPIKVKVPVELVGTPLGVKQGGFLDVHLREISIETTPKDMPEKIEIDISSLKIGGYIKAANIPLPENCKLLESPDTIIVRIGVPKTISIEEEKLKEEAKEPEVITKGKKEEEEEKEEEEKKEEKKK